MGGEAAVQSSAASQTIVASEVYFISPSGQGHDLERWARQQRSPKLARHHGGGNQWLGLNFLCMGARRGGRTWGWALPSRAVPRTCARLRGCDPSVLPGGEERGFPVSKVKSASYDFPSGS